MLAWLERQSCIGCITIQTRTDATKRERGKEFASMLPLLPRTLSPGYSCIISSSSLVSSPSSPLSSTTSISSLPSCSACVSISTLPGLRDSPTHDVHGHSVQYSPSRSSPCGLSSRRSVGAPSSFAFFVPVACALSASSSLLLCCSSRD